LLSSVTSALYKERFGSGTDATVTATLNPAFRYLRVSLSGYQPALLVLGYVDADPQGDIEVWYSAAKEVVRTQQGRIVGTAGLALDWRRVHFSVPPPAWSAVTRWPASYTRVREEIPGYRFGLTDNLSLEPVAGPPTLALSRTLPSDVAQTYAWYRENSESQNLQALPPSWFALASYRGNLTVVYSFQCLSQQLCLSLQRWPLEKAPT